MTTLYLIRHGATAQNDSRPVVLQGHGIDGPLSATGVAQATQLSQLLAKLPLTAVYSSPMRRARETAEQISQPHRLPVMTHASLHEVDVGAWEGLSWTQIMQQQPVEYARFNADPGRVPYRGGESYRDVLERVGPAVEQLLAQHYSESIAIVAHNVVNRVLLADLLGIPLRRAKDIRQGNCCVNVIRSDPPDVAVVTMNAELELFDEPTILASRPKAE